MDLRRDPRRDPADQGRATRCSPTRPSPTRARPSGWAVFGSLDEAAARHRLGVRRLLLLELPAGDPTADLDTTDRLGLAGSPYPTVAELLDDLRGAILADVVDARPPVRTPEEYVALLAVGREALETRTRPVLTEVLRILSDWRDVDRMLSGRAELATLPALQDMREQLARLVSRGFLGEAGAERLRRFPTYLLAVRRRRERLEDDVLRDRQLMDQVTGVAGRRPPPARRAARRPPAG